jgi:signal peptidase II
LVGGACGNLVDRLVRAPGFLRGEVVDFIDVGPWPTFNLADSAITVGAVLLVIDVVMSGCSARRARAGS